MMRFCQLDQITLLEPGERLEAQKTVTGKEDYLRDHFPRFAVMPGVLMLEALYQASALLVRATLDHEPGLVVLKSAKNVKFADFVQPGETLLITAEVLKQGDEEFLIKATGRKEDSVAVSGRLVVSIRKGAEDEIVDKHAALYMKQLAEQLQQAPMACS